MDCVDADDDDDDDADNDDDDDNADDENKVLGDYPAAPGTSHE